MTTPPTDSPTDAPVVPDSVGAFIEYLGLEMTELTGERVVATWTAGPHVHQPYGIVHGGAHCSVVETLASLGGGIWFGDRGQVVGVNNSTDFYRGVSEGELTSIATPIHRGRSQQVWVVETRDVEDRLIACGQVRLQNLEPRPSVDRAPGHGPIGA